MFTNLIIARCECKRRAHSCAKAVRVVSGELAFVALRVDLVKIAG